MRIARLSAALTVFAMCACSREEAATPDENLGSAALAVVNGKPIPESVVRIYTLATERQNFDALPPADRERIVNDVIGLELLSQQADKEGVASSRTLVAQIELQRLQTVARAMAADYLEKNPPSDADIKAIYDENLSRLSGEQYKARHILVTTKEEADSVITQLRNGAQFIALAQERADGPTGPNGGALDWFTLDSMPPSFAEAVAALAVGAYSQQPVQTEAGYHVILLEDKRRQEPPALEEIRDQLASAAERKHLDDYIKTLREAATVSTGP
jgi:peptidyl-prolyl cis-trans isomerase C